MSFLSGISSFVSSAKSVVFGEEANQLKNIIASSLSEIVDTNSIFDQLKAVQQDDPYVSTSHIQQMQPQQLKQETKDQAISLINKLIQQAQAHEVIVEQMQKAIEKHIQIIEDVERKQEAFGQQTIQQVIDISNGIQLVDRQIGKMIANVQHQSIEHQKHIHAIVQAAKILQVDPIEQTKEQTLGITPIDSLRQHQQQKGQSRVSQQMGRMIGRDEEDRAAPIKLQRPKKRIRQIYEDDDQLDQNIKRLRRQTQSSLRALFG